ncbi:hypothetical protein G8759_22165 [Spirosoma aureum]|uniref:Uncharacterized protein n=1 Tax=Spirosoma aureum TaxID=2692134 RepID=A0A6G9ASE1_9BACT|nr:DUF6544 family protein [Spirosoma aureum]QIP15133.1 hypothetical protein G8759_22165 [Spirosoma aureum]
MLRFLFASLLLIHGMIHVLGYVNQWVLNLGTQLGGKSMITLSAGMSKLLGILWLLTGLCYLVASTAYWLQRDWWLAVALVSTLLSQVLIFIYWPEAKAGTIVNVLIAFVIGITSAHNRFEKYADREVRQLLNQPIAGSQIITHEMLGRLPSPVQKWMITSGVVGKELVHTVRLQQRGLMRTSPNGTWMPTKAEQYIDVDKPGFVWKADVQLFSLLPLAGLDTYVDGKGNMQIKGLSFIPIVNASNAKMDQGELLRYLSEMCWYPSAALSPFITWQPIDNNQSQATMSYKGVTASAIFTFDNQHRLVRVAAKRYKGSDAKSQLEDWYIPARAWKSMDGITIPVKGDVIWKLPAGDFNYYQWEITDIDYNRPVLY